jgi:hypothetical protein
VALNLLTFTRYNYQFVFSVHLLPC